MDQRERQVIDDLFGKLRDVERQSPQRDADAEGYIRRQVAESPAAPYYMAQALLVQEQALARSQSRIQQLEQQLAQRGSASASGGGGFLSSIFGGGQPAQQPAPRPQPVQPQYVPPSYMQPGHGGGGYGSPWGGRGMGMGGGGGGFLAGALQTALGVAGGMLVADAISNAFEGGAAQAGELAAGAGDAAAGFQESSFEGADPGQDAGFQETSYEDAGGDFGGEEEV